MPGDESRLVVVGRIGAPYGVRGWVRLRSFTDPPENIASYSPWRLRRGTEERYAEHVAIDSRGKGLIARLDGVADRDAAAEMAGMDVLVERARFGPVDEGQYYWSDLLGLEVRTVDGMVLGRVEELMGTGANDVLVVTGDRRRLIPFLRERVVREVDLDARCIVVDWDPEF